jgi:hypothetical protein
MFVQHLVEVLAPHLIGVRRTAADRTGEGVGVVAAFVVRLEVRARLEHAQRADLVQHAEPLEYRQIHGQQRFADMKSRVMRLLQRNDPVAAPRQQCRRGAAAGAAADHRHVTLLGRRSRRIHHEFLDPGRYCGRPDPQVLCGSPYSSGSAVCHLALSQCRAARYDLAGARVVPAFSQSRRTRGGTRGRPLSVGTPSAVVPCNSATNRLCRRKTDLRRRSGHGPKERRPLPIQ